MKHTIIPYKIKKCSVNVKGEILDKRIEIDAHWYQVYRVIISHNTLGTYAATLQKNIWDTIKIGDNITYTIITSE